MILLLILAAEVNSDNNSNYLLLGVASVITASVGGYAIWKKLKPETTNIHVGSSSQLIEMAVRAGTFVEGQRDSLNQEVHELRDAFDKLEERLDGAEDAARKAELRADRAERRADRAERKYEEEKAVRETLEAEVEKLRKLVEGMRKVIQDAGITIPMELFEDGDGDEASSTEH